MTSNNLVDLLRKIKVETGSLMCLGCGYEHDCGIHGCAIMRTAADRIANQDTHIRALQRAIENLRKQNEQPLPATALVAKENADLLERRWIPVTEQLPEDPVKKVLIFVPHRHGNIVDVGRYLGAAGWVPDGWYLTQASVTHWMPLPEPPEEET